MKWLMNEEDPDMYDARMQDWYTNAAASSKVNKVEIEFGGIVEVN